ncbi:MAG: Crp/Fnr family transcriptional regulator [Saprospiraceae bacterium]|jgi:CRP-like cAMP-binding protein|nr:Crp/Fnr family transcriptional regulator [Saprospiraceae bacterium]
MHIDTNLLIAHGAVAKKYNKGDFIFYEGDQCRFYFQVLEGCVRMCNYNDEGRIFIQGLFTSSQSFGEPPLFIDETYPACAQAETNCVIYKLSKEILFKLLSEYPQLQMNFIINFAQRLYEKSSANKNIISPHPEERILGFLKKYKKDQGDSKEKVIVPYTRQQIADFLGLRVETVIRTLLKMEEEGKVDIRKHKLFY